MEKEENRKVIAKIPVQDTRLFHARYDNHENLNNLLKTEIDNERKKDPKGMPVTNPGCWRSGFKYKCEQELMKPISMILASWTDHFMPNVPMDAKINYWTNVNKPGTTNIFHSHYRADADLSGVYYVQGYKTGVIRFATHEQMYKMIPEHMPHASMIGHDPRDGDTLCFASYLLHDVSLNTSDRNRVTIAFNAKIVVQNVVPFPKEKK